MWKEVSTMRHIQTSAPVRAAQLLKPTLVGNTLTESDILSLQNVFLCNGIHYIQTPSHSTGRTFITSFVHSLALSGEIGCLTTELEPLDLGIIDMYQKIQEINPTGLI